MLREVGRGLGCMSGGREGEVGSHQGCPSNVM